jgi:hypothetical protein
MSKRRSFRPDVAESGLERRLALSTAAAAVAHGSEKMSNPIIVEHVDATRGSHDRSPHDRSGWDHNANHHDHGGWSGHHFQGGLQGSYSTLPGPTDLGKTIELNGSGYFHHMGKVTISGWIQSPGLIQNGQSHGEATLTNSRGSVQLSLTGPVQKGFSSPSGTFQYQELSGTGEYSQANQTGQVEVSITPGTTATTGTFSFKVDSTPPMKH